MALRLVPCVRSPQCGQRGQRQGVALLASVRSGNSAFRWDEQLCHELHAPTQSLRALIPSARATANPASQHLPLPLLLRSKTWSVGRPSRASHSAQAPQVLSWPEARGSTETLPSAHGIAAMLQLSPPDTAQHTKFQLLQQNPQPPREDAGAGAAHTKSLPNTVSGVIKNITVPGFGFHLKRQGALAVLE